MTQRKKLIEVALPLAKINDESAHEKSIHYAHPSTIHPWWARRPHAAARAVIFAQLVDDPASVPEEFPTPQAQARERERLFQIIKRMVTWGNATNEQVLEQARAAIQKSWARECLGADRVARLSDAEIAGLLDAGAVPPPPPFYDPFAGGGTLPLEAQRLGLTAHAGDLNPVAVLINKAMIEIPPRFAGLPPVNPDARADRQLFAREWRGAHGLAEDVRYYGQWMRAEAQLIAPSRQQSLRTLLRRRPPTGDAAPLLWFRPPRPTRVGRDAGRIAEEVIAHLVGQLGAEVKVTLEIEARLPNGANEQIVRIVTENCRALKFTDHGFETEEPAP